MSTLQIKNLPDSVHAALSERSRSQGLTMSEYVTRLLRRDLARPTISEWVAEQQLNRPPARSIDVNQALTEVRTEYAPDYSPEEPAEPKEPASALAAADSARPAGQQQANR